MRRAPAIVLAIAALLFAAEATLLAQQDQSEPAPAQLDEESQATASDLLEGEASLDLDPSLQWEVMVQPYFWIPFQIDGDSTVDGQTVDLDISIDDVFDNADVFGLSGRIEAWNNDRWGLFFDGLYVNLDFDSFQVDLPGPAPTIKGDLDIEQALVDLGAGYRIVDSPLGGEESPNRIQIDLLGGLRYQYLKQEIELSGPPDAGDSFDWVEPMFGARVSFMFGEKVALALRGDVSGFGIGSASDLTWNAMAGFQYSFNPRFSMILAYRALGIDYSRGSGTSKFGIDAILHGPWLGISIQF